MRNDSVVKICLSGLILALVIIFTRFLSIQNIPVLPFARISLGPALIIFASILLGPIYGGIVGGASDILGILLVPNSLGYSINPWFTLVYTCLGILPWCIYKLAHKIKNEKISLISFIAALATLWIFVLIYGLTNQTINGKTYEVYQKVIVFVASFLLSVGTVIAIIFINKNFKKKTDISVMSIALSCLISEIALMLVANSIVKAIFFEIDLVTIIFFQSIVFFINIPLNTFVVSYLYRLASKVLTKKEITRS